MEFKDFSPYYEVDEGLNRLRGNRALYARLISSYCGQLSLQQFEDALTRGDFNKALSEIHTIKGASANLSMKLVHSLSQDVERLMKNRQDYSSQVALLKEAISTTKELVSELTKSLK